MSLRLIVPFIPVQFVCHPIFFLRSIRFPLLCAVLIWFCSSAGVFGCSYDMGILLSKNRWPIGILNTPMVVETFVCFVMTFPPQWWWIFEYCRASIQTRQFSRWKTPCMVLAIRYWRKPWCRTHGDLVFPIQVEVLKPIVAIKEMFSE